MQNVNNDVDEIDEMVAAVASDKDVDPIKLQKIIQDLQEHEEMLKKNMIHSENKVHSESKNNSFKVSKKLELIECEVCKNKHPKSYFKIFNDFEYYDDMGHDENYYKVCNDCSDKQIEQVKVNHVEKAIKCNDFITVQELIDILNLLDKQSKIAVNISTTESCDGCQVNHIFYFRKPIPKLFTTTNETKYYKF